MNRKGFTLVELLAVIVLLALVLAIAIPTSIVAYKKAKLKTEDVFVKRLSEVVDDYISLGSQDLLENGDKFQFQQLLGNYRKTDTGIGLAEDWSNYKVYKTTKTIQDLIDNNLLFEAKYINPNNKNYSYIKDGITHNTCNLDAEIEIYKDSEAVYCHKIRFNSLVCLTEDYKEIVRKEQGLESDDNDYNNPYVIDTCVWYKEGSE